MTPPADPRTRVLMPAHPDGPGTDPVDDAAADPGADAALATGQGAEPSRSLHVGAGTRWRRWRTLVVVGTVVLLAAVLLSWLTVRDDGAALSAEGTGPGGARAVVEVLRETGVDVERSRTSTDALDGADADTTIAVTQPALLSDDQITAVLGSPATVVLLAPGGAVERYGLPITALPGSDVGVTEPGCRFAPAENAGAALAGSQRYEAPEGTTTCYDGALVRTEAGAGTGAVLVLGAEPFTNRLLDDDGNAALALGVLGGGDRVVWYEPTLESADGEDSLLGLAPDWVLPVAVQLALAALLAAWWRGRRLGRVVTEPLPVVVRGTEATEGTARLYRRGHDHGHAAGILRTAALTRLRSRLRLPRTSEVTAVVTAVAERTGRDPHEVATVLAGTDPSDDAALVRLADQLDALEREVHPT